MSEPSVRMRRLLVILGLVGMVIVGFVWIPIPALEPTEVDAEQVAEFAQRTDEHFATIVAGTNLGNHVTVSACYD